MSTTTSLRVTIVDYSLRAQVTSSYQDGTPDIHKYLGQQALHVAGLMNEFHTKLQ
ncbi:hypothetical protein BDQ17DRAFT_987836 [Cyathus striatus]|nr:hypothetical protein BDQ17DRAFT_987836 [Cyathus striatus]